MTFRLAAGALVLAIAVPAGATTLGQTTLGKLVGGADVIAVALVSRVVEVPAGEAGGITLAEVSVLRPLKGCAGRERLWLVAEPRSGVDCSRAVAGEKALLFLDEIVEPVECLDEQVEARLRSPEFREESGRLTGGAPLLTLCWAGYGRMPIEALGGTDYAALCAYYVRLPADLPTVPGADPRFDDWDRRVPLDRLIARVAGQRAPLTLPPGEAAGLALELLDALDADTIPGPSPAVEGLLEDGCDEMRPVLLALLEDPGCPRRDTVAEALVLTDDGDPDVLLEGLKSTDARRRRAAAWGLEWAVATELAGPDPPVLEALAAACRDADPEVRAYAVGALGRCREEAFDAVLTDALSDGDPRVRRSAVRTLVARRMALQEDPAAEKAEAALRALATGDDAELRREAWEVLGCFAGAATMPTAMHALADPDPAVRHSAIRALGRLDVPEARERLVAALAAEDPEIRRRAAHALGIGSSAEAAAPLAKALGDTDRTVVDIAIEALGEMGPVAAPAVPALERLREATKDRGLAADIEDVLAKIRG